MNRLVPVTFHAGSAYHLAPEPDPARVRKVTTLCGLSEDGGMAIHDPATFDPAGRPLCQHCEVQRAYQQAPTAPPEVREAIGMPAGFNKPENRPLVGSGGPIAEVTGCRVFRVTGSTDIYTVTFGPSPIQHCTCMAGKTHPEKWCKHISAVAKLIAGQG